jgi:hypothetical protein
LTGLHLNRLLAVTSTDAGDLAVNVGAGFNELHHAKEVLKAGAELVSRVDLQLLPKDGQAAKLTSLKHTALTTLPADDEADLKC